MPDFQPFWDSIFQNRVLPQIEWNSIMEILPSSSWKVQSSVYGVAFSAGRRLDLYGWFQHQRWKSYNQRGAS